MLRRYVVVPSNGPNEGTPEANVQRGKTRSSRNRQLRNKVNLPMFPVRYEPYPSARNRRAARNLRPPDWSNVPLPSYQRGFYTEHTRTAQRSSEEVEAYRNANEIIVTGRDVPKPILHTLVKLTCATKESWELAQKFTNDPVNISVGTATQEQQNKRVDRVVLICEKAKKVGKLVNLLKDILRDDTDQAIVFVERQQTVEHLASILCLQGWPAVGIHAKKTDQEHQEAFNALCSGKAFVLVATDMATKPIQLDRVRFVVSYDHPVHSSDYRRRYGHAIRLDGRGRTYTFLAPDDHVRARELMRFFRDNKLPLPHGLRKVANKVVQK
ncbi:hypothetical protein HPB51_003187 [Rhipicephalus microplus]|uniref:Helicase C-terminal domain-containing protein n=1 Tax=Rhipicephalus microplus TaxID=6941 RepID=A0A9J6ELB2_RHIMP|nr:hypothetical protein HPB51_003187 [Rhipicephalus microplus]